MADVNDGNFRYVTRLAFLNAQSYAWKNLELALEKLNTGVILTITKMTSCYIRLVLAASRCCL